MKNSENLSDRKQMLLKFWNGFNDYIAKSDIFKNDFTIRKAQPDHWYDLSVGNSSYHICMTISAQKKRISCGVYIPDNKDLFHTFEDNKDIFQKEFGENGDWKEAAKATRIVIYKGFDLYNETKWEEAYAWFVENAIKTKRVFKKME